MAINSLTGYSSTSNGLSGLVSGMDTQSMVDKLLSGTQSKIDKQNAARQQLLWKQEIYRDVISSIHNFQTNFFSFSKPETNLLSQKFFNSMAAAYKSDAVKISATNSAQAGKLTINSIKQLASAYKQTSTHPVTGELSGTVSTDKFQEIRDMKRKITINVGDTTESIEFSGGSNEAVVADINAKIAANTELNGKVTAKLSGGKLVLEATDASQSVKVSGSAENLEVLGLKDGQSGTGSISGTIDLSKAAPKIKVILDGVEKTIELSDAAVKDKDGNTLVAGTAAAIAENLKNSITKAFGNGIDVKYDGGKITLSTTGSRQVTVSGAGGSAGLAVLGLKEGQSNKTNLNMKLGDINFGQKLQGSTFSFTINGTKIEATKNDTLSSVINRINSSQAGVTVSYSSLQDSFTMESKTMGEGVKIDMEQDVGNLLTVMFGQSSSGSALGVPMRNPNIHAENSVNMPADLKTGEFRLNINGRDITVKLPEKEDGSDYTAEEAVAHINEELKSIAGVDKNGNANIGLSLDAGKVSLKSAEGFNVTFSQANVDDAAFTKALGFAAGQNQRVTDTTSMSDLGLTSGSIQIGGTAINLSSYTTFADFKTALDNAAKGAGGSVVFDEQTGVLGIMGTTSQFTVEGNDDAGKAAMEKLFGVDQMVLNSTALSSPLETQGENAILTVNGQEIVRNTNSFTIDGLNIELVEKFNEAKDPNQKIEVNTTRDTEQTYKGIESFVNEYNKLIDKLNKLIDEDNEYSKYPPLTAAQKKEMSEKEVELWEEKSKTGLVRKDSIISSILGDMRMALFQKPDDAKFALYEIGISTSNNWKDKGKLVISDPEALKLALSTDPSEVEKLFTDTNKGLAATVNDIMEKATKANSGSPGSLVSLAGIKGATLDKNSSLDKQLKDIDDKIANLKRTYETEKTRYWKQFNAMEQMISNMNQQSSWLMQQFAS
ncbi:flagellar filament capping protein FliD [Hydrogenoanaerobacterium sp.]|uniref:flagellar filament capping protein FliD n=1 Tax=Hydrogenoanaerobacterium sp. TaxID=2953763 RepID=UPI00289CC78A|nr:flagellar filament capping protein FliD [Hydrogenoanaerobacterium sp.]